MTSGWRSYLWGRDHEVQESFSKAEGGFVQPEVFKITEVGDKMSAQLLLAASTALEPADSC